MAKRLPQHKSLLGPTVFMVLGVALLLGLGTWQVQRLYWKTALIAARAAGVAAPPVELPRDSAAAATLEFHHVRAAGRYVGQAILMHAISLDGAQGYLVIMPLALGNGGTVLIDRGFVPDATTVAAPAGEVEVTGLLRLAAGKPSWFTPDNAPARGEWFYLDPSAMAKAAGVARVLPFYVDADRAPDPKALPLGGQTPLDLPNNHLQYAITWYALAGGLVIVYILLVRKRKNEAP